MTANIKKILALFPKPEINQAVSKYTDGFTIRGKCPYNTIRSTMPGALAPILIGVIDVIREDIRWGPVFGGDLSNYGNDHSQADLALCGELARQGLDAGCIDTAMRSSGLYRDKWERDDYRRATIAKAIPRTQPSADIQTRNVLDLKNGKIRISTSEPPPRDWTIESLLLAGKSAVLAGFGGVSKTQLAIQLSIAIVLGTPFAGKSVTQGKVMLLLGEEDQDEISRRTNAVVRNEKLDQNQIDLLMDGMYGFPFVGQDMRLAVKKHPELTESHLVQGIVDTALEMDNVRLIVLDHLALLHGGDFNAREDAALTMRLVNHICQKTGAAVLLLAHTPKSAAVGEESNASMVAGSTAFVDQARGAWILATMRENEAKKYDFKRDDRLRHVSLSIVKNNYGPTGDIFWFERFGFDNVGLLKPVYLEQYTTCGKGMAGLEDRIIDIIQKSPGRYSKTRFRDTQSSKKNGPLKASKSEVDRAIDNLLVVGCLTNREPSSKERNQYGLSAQVKHVLDLK